MNAAARGGRGMKRAWIVCWALMPEITGIVAAEKRSEAVKACFDSLDDCGYVPLRWIDISAKRVPKYDMWAAKQTRQTCFTKEYVEKHSEA